MKPLDKASYPVMLEAPFRHAQAVVAPVPASVSHALSNVVRALRLAIVPYAVSRVALFVAAWAAVAAGGYARVNDPHYPAPLQAWLSWDAVHYLRLATAGYPATATAVDTGYFPLLPALLHLTGGGALTSVALAFTAGLAALVALCALTGAVLGEEAARRTAWVACWWPEAFVLSAVYTEGPFLLLAVAALGAAWRRLPVVAAGLAAAAALMRPTGVLLALPLLALLPAGRARLAALAPIGAAAGFAGYLWLRTGNVLAFVVSQTANHHVHPGEPALAGLASGRPDDLVGLPCLLAAALLTVQLWRMRELGRWRSVSLLLVAVLLVPPLTSGTLSSYGRYAAVAFPLFWAASTLRLARLAPAAAAASVAVVAVCAMGRVTP